MRKLIFVCVAVIAISFTSCGGNKETIVPENEKQELYGINKGDSTTDDGSGNVEHDMDED